jgi:hypothetical protein
MFKFILGRDLKTELYATKKIKVAGVRFTIKKINLLNYLDGSELLLKKFDIHKTAGAKEAPANNLNEKKAKQHYAEVLVAGVVEPKLVFKAEEEGILVDDLFINWEMVVKLYGEIILYTYGKKKMKQLISAAKGLSKSTP